MAVVPSDGISDISGAVSGAVVHETLKAIGERFVVLFRCHLVSRSVLIHNYIAYNHNYNYITVSRGGISILV